MGTPPSSPQPSGSAQPLPAVGGTARCTCRAPRPTHPTHARGEPQYLPRSLGRRRTPSRGNGAAAQGPWAASLAGAAATAQCTGPCVPGAAPRGAAPGAPAAPTARSLRAEPAEVPGSEPQGSASPSLTLTAPSLPTPSSGPGVSSDLTASAPRRGRRTPMRGVLPVAQRSEKTSRPRERPRGLALLRGIPDARRGCTQGGDRRLQVSPCVAQAFRWDTSRGPFSPPSHAAGSQLPAEADRVTGALVHVSGVCGGLAWADCDRGVPLP